MGSNGRLYQYLEARGVLGQGEEAISAAKKDYRRDYLREHKRKQRHKAKEHTIICSPMEEKVFATEAKLHGIRVAEYVRMAALAYAQKRYLVPRTEAVYRMQQQIALLRTQIEKIMQEKRGLFERDRSESIEVLLSKCEEHIRTGLLHPKSLEHELKSALDTDQSFVVTLTKILEDHAGKIDGQRG